MPSPRPISRRKARPGPVEPLEGRALLAASLVAKLDPGVVRPHDLIVANGSLFFFLQDTGTKADSLWKLTGGAAPLARPILAIPGTPGSLTNVGGTLYFTVGVDSHHFQLWRSDGTAPGTKSIKDFVDTSPFAFAPS